MSHNMTYNFRKRNLKLNYNEEKLSYNASAQNKDVEIVKVVSKNVRVKRQKMNSKPTPVLYFDIVRDVFVNFHRKTLCQVQIVNKLFNLIIEKTFNNSPPYLCMPELQYYNNQWTMKVENNSTVPVNLIVIQKIIASKFIRVRLLRTFLNDNFQPMQLLDMSHVWENGKLRLFWDDIQGFYPTEEFNRSLSNCGELCVYGSNAISILHELNSGSIKVLKIYDFHYDPIVQEIPWAKITDYLFSAVQNSDFRIYISTNLSPNQEKTMEFINFVKERFQDADVFVNFTFHWWANYKGWTFPEIDIQNKQTKQSLKLSKAIFSNEFSISIR